MSPTNLILASGSAARSQMLSSAGVEFQTNVARIDEELIKASMAQEEYPPRDIADALAQAKAAKVSSRHPGALVLGADQILVFDGKIYDKPKSLEDAQTQLKTLRGQTHRLISAAVMMKDNVTTFRHIQITKLIMRDFSDQFLTDYLREEGDAILSCVGGYRLEGAGAQLFRQIDGDYFTVLGLPLLACLEHLRDQGILIR